MATDSMNDAITGKTHWIVWLIGGISLLWHLMGCANYLWQASMSPDTLLTLSEGQRAIIENRPAWATGAFAIAVFGGAVASILLLLRKRLALVFFVIALTGVIVSMIPVFGILNSGVYYTMGERVMYFALTPLFGAIMLWFTRFAIRCGWIGSVPGTP